MSIWPKYLTQWLLAALLLHPDVALAGTCMPNLVPRPAGTAPALKGQLAFEGFRNGATHVFYYDLANTGAGIQQVDAGFVAAYNPNFSPDGKWIVFFGQPNGQCGPSGDSNTLFVYNLAKKVLSALIACDANSYQDVRFFPSQQYIVFKEATSPTSRNVVYARITLNTAAGTASLGALCNVTNDNIQHSAPSVSESQKYIYYFNSPNPTGTPIGIYRSRFTSTCPAPTSQAVTAQNNNAYYPVARDLTLVFYTRHSANATINGAANDQLFSIAPDTDQPTIESQLDLNDCNQNTNDAAPVDENYVIFSQGGANEQLFVGDIAHPYIWSLSSANQSATAAGVVNLRGASYSAKR